MSQIRTEFTYKNHICEEFNKCKINTVSVNEEEELTYLTFPILEQFHCVKHLFSTRLGGVSEGIFSTMNLSFTRGDKEEAVLENYRRIGIALSKQKDGGENTQYSLHNFVCSDQTHTTNVRIVNREDMGKGVLKERDYTDVDGLITNEKGIILSTFYADCVPLYLVDPVKEVIGLSHSGWKGTASKMGLVTANKMREVFGCNPGDIYAVIGPSICQDCYEVSEDVISQFQITFQKDGDILKDIMYQKENKKYQLDLWKANYYILLEAGILKEHIQVTDLCTSHNPDFLFSHRKTNGKRGNLGAFLVLV